SNDNSSIVIVIVKLVGAENDQMWATAMKIVLKGKNKMGFIDGTFVKQETSVVLFQQWKRCNAIVLGWILGSLSQELEFNILTILPACVCEGRTACACDAKSGSVNHTQLIRLMWLLMGLNDVYQPIGSTILAKDP
nr:hypothetical protein [Tanacetum cinerariifolium]